MPFDSGRKLMSTLHNTDGQFMMFTKGAPGVINHLGIIGLLALVPFVVIQLYKIIRTFIAK